MNSCAFHPNNFAAVQCNSCARALCPACDHRIRGFPFCADCIVSGIELLRSHQQSSGTKPRQTSPVLATVLSLFCPGLGAAYNGQTAKAIVHFAFFVSLFQMAILTNGMALFVLGFLGIWLFAAVDAWRAARAIRAGLTNAAADDLWLQKITAKPLTWAIAFIGLGTMFFLHTTFGLRLPVREILPLALIVIGVYWLTGYFRRKRETGGEADFNPTVVRGHFPTTNSFQADDFPTVVSNPVSSRFQR
ncbi:MAG TPA: hypothetical protein VEX64_06775 [Pyrinomonadaceae bacterium]|nr:hypothetical protein [Pyrinomonadaceae bacterium]